MSSIINTFSGRKQELDQWSTLLADPADTGQAVVVVGKYGMGKTWLLDQMVIRALENEDLRCFSARYIVGPGESPGMILRIILDDMFQAARYEVGSLDAEGKRFKQWLQIYRELGFFSNRTDHDFRFLDQLRFDCRKNIFEQFINRIKIFSDLLPEHGRLLFAIDPEHDTLAARVELWTQVVKNLPPKIFFLVAQRFKDSLAINEEFRAQSNVHFIPPLNTQEQGLADLTDVETERLFDTYVPMYKNKSIDRRVTLEHFRLYRNHPYAVRAALNLLLSPSFTSPDQLPKEPIPAAVCPLQWKGVTEHPLRGDAVRLFKTYAVLEVPTLDEMACWVADISHESLEQILADPFLASMIRTESDGRLLYHHYLMSYVRALLYDQDGTLTPDAEQLHQRAMMGYADLTSRTVKPDPLSTVRLAEHSLVVGGPTLFAQTLCRSSEAFLSLGFFQTYAALIDRALALVSPLSTEAAELYLQLGELRRLQGDRDVAYRYYEVSLQTARRIAEPEHVASALIGLGRIALENGHLLEAEMWLRDAIPFFEVGESKQGLAEVSVLIAEVNWLQGHTAVAEKALDTATQATGDIKNPRKQAKMMSAIYAAWGRMYDQMGNAQSAAEQYHKALDLTKDIYDREAEANVRTSLSAICERVGNLKLAEEHLSKAMSIYQDIKSLELWAESNLLLARIVEMQGKPKVRDYHIEQARQMYLQLGNKKKLEELGR